MSISGPQGRPLYRPHEAYNMIGQRFFGSEWEGRFTGQAAIAHLPLARKHAEMGIELSPELKTYVEADPQDADRAQTQRHREEKVLKELLDALLWGKAECWVSDSNWRPMPVYDYHEGSEARAEFIELVKEEIAEVLSKNLPPRNRLLIDQKELDRWVATNPLLSQRRVEPKKPNPAHRPAHDWKVIREEFHSRCQEGQVRVDVQGWRSREAEHLAAWFVREHPEAVPKLTPDAETIRKRLKPEFDAYAAQVKAG